MSNIVYRISTILRHTLISTPIGTNLGLYSLLWTILTGALLRYRGALTPALGSFQLSKEQARRSIAALAEGQWKVQSLVSDFETFVVREGKWQPHSYDGYSPVAADLTGFYRPQLKNNAGKHYYAPAGRALPAITLGLFGAVGSIKGQRLALPRGILKPDDTDPRDSTLQTMLIKAATKTLANQEVLIFDAGCSLEEMRHCEVPRFVVRLARNDTALRNSLPPPKEKGRPCEYGEKVCPLPKTFKGRRIEATTPDLEMSWEYQGRIIRAEIWKNLVRPGTKPGGKTFQIIAVYDPMYKEPLLLATNVADASAKVVWFLYKDRWAIEQVPLAGKTKLGGASSFVHSSESRHRLPGLVLLAGSILSFVSASEEAIPTGYWDLECKPTLGRLQRSLSGLHFSNLPEDGEFLQIREKRSNHSHLLKGVLGHRRQKRFQEAATTEIAA